MKYKKYSYILVLTLMLLVGINGVNAEAKYQKTCYYKDEANDMNGILTLKSGYDCAICHDIKSYSGFEVRDKSNTKIKYRKEKLNNWFGGMGSMFESKESKGGVVFENFYENSKEANEDSNPSCPKYVVVQVCTAYRVWATNSEGIAIRAVNEINNTKGCKGFYTTYGEEVDGEFVPYTEEEYDSGFGDPGFKGPNESVTCETLFGEKNDDGVNYDPNGDGESSIRYFLNEILMYPKIIVPILIIVLGTLDFAKAVLASKEDEMRKAQATFVKRVLIGVVIFFVPTIVDIIMELADIVLVGFDTSCRL